MLQSIGFPVFARGLCINGTGKDFGAIGWLNAPIPIGDTVVQPGDLVAGDTDGVVVIPHSQVADVLSAASEREKKEAGIIEHPESGGKHPRHIRLESVISS